MPPPPLDILIIGAGPVGLATAVGAVHRGAKRILIVEQAQDLRPVGNPVNLLPNAQNAIAALAPGISERLQPFRRSPDPSKPRVCTVSSTGEDIDARHVPSLATLQWWQLQRLLLDALPDEGVLVLNHQLIDIQHEDSTGLVCAEFVANRQRRNIYKNWDDSSSGPPLGEATELPDGSYQCRPEFERSGMGENWDIDYGPNATRVKCWAKVLVGADGINSVARRCVYRDCGKGWENYSKALYSGITRFGIFGEPNLSPNEGQLLDQTYRRNSDFVTITVKRELISYDSLRVLLFQFDSKIPFTCYLSFFAPVHKETAQNASQEDLRRLVTDLVREGGFSEALLQLFDRLWETGSRIRTLPFYSVPANHPMPFKRLNHGEDLEYPPGFQRPWHHRRVVLAGDAIHAFPPFLAQGSAMGLEDAFELVTLMGQSGIWSLTANEVPSEEVLCSIFHRYRASRLNRVCKVQRLTMNRTSEYEIELVSRNNAEIFGYEPEAVAESLGAKSEL
eukprot:GFKZ01015917.1.p1 GENE.GFKZ01015917.1~~GFKZ01015917.1.p1  ORF type:complete len:533 (+),score=53.18 GFKZ01015917.1:83-1600(+)